MSICHTCKSCACASLRVSSRDCLLALATEWALEMGEHPIQHRNCCRSNGDEMSVGRWRSPRSGLMTHSAATHARCACILVHILHPRVWLHFELGWHTSSLTSSSEKCKSAIVVLLASILNQSCQFTCLDVFTEQQKHQLQRTRTEQTYGEAFPPNLGAKGESCLLTPKTDKKWTQWTSMNRFMSWR